MLYTFTLHEHFEYGVHLPKLVSYNTQGFTWKKSKLIVYLIKDYEILVVDSLVDGL